MGELAEGRESIDLADKLNKLFAVRHKASEAPLSNAAAAEGITAKTGVRVSAADLYGLRNRRTSNPPVAQLQAIAQFFGVTPSYLTNPGAHVHIEAQLDLLQAVRDAGVRYVSPCATGSTPAALDGVRAMIDHATRQSGRVDDSQG